MSDNTIASSEPLTLASLIAKRPPYQDIPIAGLGTFRMNRLSSYERLKMRMDLGSMTDENGEPDEEQIINCMSRVICKCLGGDFLTDDGLEVIRTLEFDELSELISRVSYVNGCGFDSQGSESEEIIEGKND